MDQTGPQDQFNNGNRPAIVDHPSTDKTLPGGVYAPQGRYPQYLQIDTAHENDVGFEFYHYLRILVKYRWLILAVIGGSLVLAVIVTSLTTPIFEAVTTLQIDREQMNVVKLDQVQPTDQQISDQEFFQTEYELLASKSLSERVVSNLGLADDPQFNAVTTTPFSLVMNLFSSGSKQEADKAQHAANKLSLMLSVTPVRGSKLVKIGIDHPNPALAERIANGFAQVFIADNLDRRYDATSYARKFLEDHLAQLKVKLEDSEKLMVKYADEQGIINLDDNKSLTSSDLSSMDAKLTDVRADRIKKELLWKQAQTTDGLGLKEILDNPTIQEDLKQRSTLSAQYEQKLSLFKPAYPDMVQLRSQIKELDRQIQIEAGAIKQSFAAAYFASKKEEDALQQKVDAGKAAVVDEQTKSIQYNILKREVDTNRTLYDGLLQRYKEIGVAGGIGTNNISVIDKAELPIKARSPVLWRNLLIASLLGLLGGGALALLIDYLDDSFKSPEDVERELGVTVLGAVPKPRDGVSIEEEMGELRSGMMEAYRSLRTGLQFSTSNGLPRTLFITSSQPSEGKTTTTICMAQSLSQIGLQVLLIDCDLRNASVHRRLGISNEVGLSNYLSGSKSPEEVVQTTNTKGLVLMSSGPLPPNPAELLSGPKLPALIALAAESFDVVLLDGPPIMGLADAPLIASTAQATMLVVAANETRRNTARVALRRLRMSHANVIGALLNKFDIKEVGYGYGYGYGDYDYHSYGAKELTDQSS
ncbi:MAG: polysaccharide biosynthesis tyrosine autokinase [Aestuariivirga sp.]